MSNAAVQGKTTPVSSWRQAFVTDEAWALMGPFLPLGATTGHPRKWALRRLLEAVLYLLRTGCQWRALPDTYPPYITVQRHFYMWRDAGLFERINHLLVMLDRERERRKASASAAVIDSQSAKTSETGGTKGYDGGKKLVGLKRHIQVDADGRLLTACVSPADMHDFSAAPHLLRASRRSWPFVEKVWADSAYCGKRVSAATPIRVTIVTDPPNKRGLIVQKRCWVVERTIGWVGRNRRLVKDNERHASTAVAFIFLAAAWFLMRRVYASS